NRPDDLSHSGDFPHRRSDLVRFGRLCDTPTAYNPNSTERSPSMCRVVPLALVAALSALAVGASTARAEPTFWNYSAKAPDVGLRDTTSTERPFPEGMDFFGQRGDSEHPYRGSQTVTLLTMNTVNHDRRSHLEFQNAHVPITLHLHDISDHARGTL